MPNGVICGGAVDGSNQLGAIVTCQAMARRPDGAGPPAPARFALSANLAGAGGPAPSGRLAMAWHVTIAPSWFDPSTAPPQITPFGMLYAIHDALVRPYPGYKMGPSLAEKWQESPDGKTYEFTLRPGVKVHNGDPLTTEDVKFLFERYRGAGATVLKSHVR